MSPPSIDPLDNVVWHALRGRQRALAEGDGLAARYRSSVAPFAGLPDDPSEDAWTAFAELVGPGNVGVLFRDVIDPPDGWLDIERIPTFQMTAAAVSGSPRAIGAPLGRADAPEMVELAATTKPGPFADDTVLLGSYVGVREDGRLIAMAGERIRIEGHAEISAVCTDEAHRGRGLATALVVQLVTEIRARGDLPFLHVAMANTSALQLYRGLGFEIRREVEAAVLGAPR